MALPNNQTGCINGVIQYKRNTLYLTAAEFTANQQWTGYDNETDSFGDYSWPGDPNTHVTANIGSFCHDTTNGYLWYKTTDSTNTGWVSISITSITANSGSKATTASGVVTIKSPAYADASSSATSSINTGEFVTGAFTRTLPASAGLVDGDLIEYVCTSASALVIQAVGSQKIRVGSLLSSAAGSITSTSIGDSVSLRFRVSDGFWYATSIIGTWVVA